MAKKKSEPMSRKAKILLVVSAIFTLAMGLSNVFVNIFLWKKSNNFIVIAQYNLMHYIFVALTFIFAGWLSKRKNGIWSLRLGVCFFSLFFILILLLKDSVVNYIIPLGILFGIAAGFYWLAYQVLSFDLTTPQNRDSFNGFNGCVGSISGAAAPLVAGYIIERNKNTGGYTTVFVISLVLFVVLILVSFLLRSEHYGKKLEFKKIFCADCGEWKSIKRSITAWGFRDVVIGFLVSILIFKTTGSELSVGKLSLIACLISTVAFYTEQKLIKPKRRIFSMHMGAIFQFAAVIGLVIHIGYPSLLIYTILDAAFSPFFLIPMTGASFNVINRNHDEDMRVEYVISREIALNTGRVISTGTLIGLLTFLGAERVLNYYLLFIGGAQFASLFFMRKMKILKS